ncbi:MAG TPA: chemotaxis protein CheB [Polyangiaceae bacterium]|nr:chemotaxis protein CheB [Polyangiaceae bacterium]
MSQLSADKLPAGSLAPSAVVGLGASAGGLDALSEFFASTPPFTGMAFVVVQHLSPDYKSLMPELLARHTAMPISRVQHGMRIEPNTVYLMPAQRDMSVVDGRLHLQDRAEGGLHHPIDFFFCSLAALGERAVGIVLSGTGSDGTRGCKEIHRRGGLVLVQEPGTAAFDGMPASAIEGGKPDHVLSPQRMAQVILERVGEDVGARVNEVRESAALERLIGLMSQVTQIDFSIYKPATLVRRSQRRMQELGLQDWDAFVEFMQQHSPEVERLAHEALIGVSSFFRDAAAFDFLQSEVLPHLLKTDSFDGSLRAWCAACSTGQEAYSLAITAFDVAESLSVPLKLKLFATDVSPRAIELASSGVYSRELDKQVRSERLSRYFQPCRAGYQVVRSLRQAVVFSVHNLLRDPPFSRLDLVSCRNLLIYLQPHAQRNVLTRLALALRPGGILFLGSSENIGDLGDSFEALDARGRIYRRKPTALRSYVSTSGFYSTRRAANAEPQEQRRLIEEAYRTLVQLDSPVSVIINDQNRIVHTTGDAGEFFALPVGDASLDILHLARGNLSTLLSAAIAKGRRDQRAVEYADVDLRLGTERARLDLRVVPLGDSAAGRHQLVSIRKHAAEATRSRDSDVLVGDREQLDALQNELSSTRENLQAAIEELETANEELQASNEELVASNEELQATNEELQATNEELLTANAESERRIQDLVELNADMENLMRSTNVGTLFLDEQLDVRKFNPPVCEFLSLLERDLGRPVAHIRHGLQGVELARLAQHVLESGASEQVPATCGERHVLLRAVPYQLRQATRGVVISFIDVTELSVARAELEGVMDCLPEQIAVLDANGVIVRVNSAWRAFAAQNGCAERAASPGVSYLDVTTRACAEQPEAERVLVGLREVLAGRRERFTHEYRCDSPSEERHFILDATRVADAGAVISHKNVTPIARAAQQAQNSAALYRLLFAMSQEALALIAPDSGAVVEANPAMAELAGRTADELVGIDLGRLLRPVESGWEPLLSSALRNRSVDGLSVLIGYGNTERAAKVSLSALEVDQRRLVLLRLCEPVTERLLDERAALRSRLSQAQKMEALGLLAGGVAHELNNVLTAILGVAYARQAELDSKDPLAQDFDIVRAACNRGADLTRNLLGFARAGSVAREHFELADVAKEVVSLVRRNAPPNVTIALRIGDSCFVRGDRSQIAQALMNLCINAVDAVRDAGTVEVEVKCGRLRDGTAQAGEFSFLRVIDNGIGMDEGTRDHAFEPFFTTKARGVGSGLGLSMVYGVSKSHGGFAEIESTPGKGTVVTFALPKAQSPSKTEADSTPARGAGEHVLVVDDEEMVRRAMARLLDRHGFIVESVNSGREALNRLKSPDELPVELVMLDIVMPELDGLGTLEAIRALYPTLPVLLYSGYPDRAPHKILEIDPHTAFCTKPVDPGHLTKTMLLLLKGQRGPMRVGV